MEKNLLLIIKKNEEIIFRHIVTISVMHEKIKVKGLSVVVARQISNLDIPVPFPQPTIVG